VVYSHACISSLRMRFCICIVVHFCRVSEGERRVSTLTMVKANGIQTYVVGRPRAPRYPVQPEVASAALTKNKLNYFVIGLPLAHAAMPSGRPQLWEAR
jgi:hypothetical protein